MTSDTEAQRRPRKVAHLYPDAEILARFKAKFGDIHGVLNATLEIAMEEMLRASADDPPFEERIRAAVRDVAARRHFNPRPRGGKV